MKIDAVLFDLDGTLVDSLPLIIQTYRKVFYDLKIPWGDGQVVKLIGLPLVEIAGYFVKNNESRFVDLYQHYYQLEHDNLTRLFPGTYAALCRLKELGLKIGIVTSKGKPVTMRTMAYTGLDRLMDVVVTAHDVQKPKPDPEPLLKALAVLKTAADRAVLVGDSSFDILTAQNTGVLALGVTWGLDSKEELERLNPDGLLDSWEELNNYL